MSPGSGSPANDDNNTVSLDELAMHMGTVLESDDPRSSQGGLTILPSRTKHSEMSSPSTLTHHEAMISTPTLQPNSGNPPLTPLSQHRIPSSTVPMGTITITAQASPLMVHNHPSSPFPVPHPSSIMHSSPIIQHNQHHPMHIHHNPHSYPQHYQNQYYTMHQHRGNSLMTAQSPIMSPAMTPYQTPYLPLHSPSTPLVTGLHQHPSATPLLPLSGISLIDDYPAMPTPTTALLNNSPVSQMRTPLLNVRRPLSTHGTPILPTASTPLLPPSSSGMSIDASGMVGMLSSDAELFNISQQQQQEQQRNYTKQVAAAAVAAAELEVLKAQAKAAQLRNAMALVNAAENDLANIGMNVVSANNGHVQSPVVAGNTGMGNVEVPKWTDVDKMARNWWEGGGGKDALDSMLDDMQAGTEEEMGVLEGVGNGNGGVIGGLRNDSEVEKDVKGKGKESVTVGKTGGELSFGDLPVNEEGLERLSSLGKEFYSGKSGVVIISETSSSTSSQSVSSTSRARPGLLKDPSASALASGTVSKSVHSSAALRARHDKLFSRNGAMANIDTKTESTTGDIAPAAEPSGAQRPSPSISSDSDDADLSAEEIFEMVGGKDPLGESSAALEMPVPLQQSQPVTPLSYHYQAPQDLSFEQHQQILYQQQQEAAMHAAAAAAAYQQQHQQHHGQEQQILGYHSHQEISMDQQYLQHSQQIDPYGYGAYSNAPPAQYGYPSTHIPQTTHIYHVQEPTPASTSSISHDSNIINNNTNTQAQNKQQQQQQPLTPTAAAAEKQQDKPEKPPKQPKPRRQNTSSSSTTPRPAPTLDFTPLRTTDPETQQILWVCDLCLKTYKTLNSLRDHRRIHTMVRSFHCNHENCNKSFLRSQDLMRHQATHLSASERPYECPNGCGRYYGRVDAAKRHARLNCRGLGVVAAVGIRAGRRKKAGKGGEGDGEVGGDEEGGEEEVEMGGDDAEDGKDE
ncbi:hypothetical protein HDU76_004155 [Blyttiomyces sp. JEL0837]|nr:hypothetical protein HDU76_004155 [Blyttiomyces sp. JEL0837]